ncbi:DUF3718 domain-containing protein [Neiella marina]|uniref:DUF3718 domain-containing protein n=1 Tax=Neiella holothuriorum TaxID=2870530 RepID=A0ABS7EJ52_9GAMM|nr:DUF3718 domain-containing protein [Neiella holothuriorum]MBW8192315.1 DUF3718 domain-containing protein [Neiella holothuriorum]
MSSLAKALAVSAVLSVSMISLPSANANSVEQALTSVCEYTAQNDKSRVRKALKNASLRLRDIYVGFECNGLSLLRFAMSKNADDTGEFIAKKLSKKILSAPEKDGQTILDWANANGHGGSATVAAIQSRIN